MSTAGDPIDDSEFVLRRVYFNQRGTRGAFTPNSNDTDGLSVYRASLVTSQQVKSDAQKPANEYFILRIQVGVLTSLGLSVIPDERPGDRIPGHCLIPELSHSLYNADKSRWKGVQMRLLELSDEID